MCVLHVGGEKRRGGGKVSGSVGGVERLDGVEMEGGSMCGVVEAHQRRRGKAKRHEWWGVHGFGE